MRPEMERWLLGRSPEIPRAFLPHLLRLAEEGVTPGGATWPSKAGGGPAGGSREGPAAISVGPLADLAFSALGAAARNPGRNRGAAFQLLVGDALLTYACEASLEDDDVGAVLAGLLARTGARFG